MAEDNLWTPHLKPGERVLWQADAVEQLWLGELSRRRKLGLVIMLFAVIGAILFGVAFASSFKKPEGDSFYLIPNLDLTGYFLAPVYVALIVTCIAVAIAQVFRFSMPRPAATRFAVTSARVLAVDAGGAIVDQIDGSNITDVRFRNTEPNLVVCRRLYNVDVDPFCIGFTEGTAEAKAIIEETFLEQANEQAD